LLSFGIVGRLGRGQPRFRGSISSRVKETLLSFRNVQTCSAAQSNV